MSSTTSSSAHRSPTVVINYKDWDYGAVKYMAPKINKVGGKSISVISTQTNRGIHLELPPFMTWGIADFVDEGGEGNGKYTLSMVFPGPDYANENTDLVLHKMKMFEELILTDAVKHSESWWGEKIEYAVAKHTFFPFLKFSKNKDTKKVDLSRPPSFRAKVPYYDSRWEVEIYDVRGRLIFPNDDPNSSPIDLVPKQSSVSSVIQCTGIWLGGKGWGINWKLVQCVVKPREVVSVFGKCHITISEEDMQAIAESSVDGGEEPLTVAAAAAAAAAATPAKKKATTFIEDSDDDDNGAVAATAATAAAVAAVATSPPPIIEQVITATEGEAPATEGEAPAAEAAAAAACEGGEEEPEPAVAPVAKKRVVKKKL